MDRVDEISVLITDLLKDKLPKYKWVHLFAQSDEVCLTIGNDTFRYKIDGLSEGWYYISDTTGKCGHKILIRMDGEPMIINSKYVVDLIDGVKYVFMMDGYIVNNKYFISIYEDKLIIYRYGPSIISD